MAPLVHIDAYNWENDTGEMAQRGTSFTNEYGTLSVSNHSYGLAAGWAPVEGSAWAWLPPTSNPETSVEPYFGLYNDEAADYDEVAFMAPYYLIFAAAGNDRSDNPQEGDTVYFRDKGWRLDTYAGFPPGDGRIKEGYDTIAPPATAKNIVTVGACTDAVLNGRRELSDVETTEFSSWGPTDDGRIKPDLVANGHELYVASGDCDTCYDAAASGTSLACPNASGSAILLIQHYGRLFPDGAMRSSTLKGLLLHTADDLGNLGPDYRSGWGLINIEAAAALITDHAETPSGQRMIESLLSESNDRDVYQVRSEGTAPLRLTLCWTDPEAAVRSVHDDRTRRLVNDLDLRVVAPNHPQEILPFVLNPELPAEAATHGDNRADNVEQIYIHAPIPGVYTVRVSHKGQLREGQQWYSLVSSAPAEPPSDAAKDPIPWTRQTGTTERDEGTSVAIDEQSNMYVVGSTEGSLFGDSLGGTDCIVAKFNSLGTLLWSHQFGTARDNLAHDVTFDGRGNVYVVGSTEGSITSSVFGQQKNPFIRKYDSAGSVLWTRQSDGGHFGGEAWGVTVDLSNDVYMTEGYHERKALRKYSDTGEELWSMTLFRSDLATSAKVTSDSQGNVYVVGAEENVSRSQENAILLKCDAAGTVLWRQLISSTQVDRGLGVALDGEDKVYITGFTTGNLAGTWASFQDGFVSKYDGEGNMLWVRQFGTPNNDAGNDIAIDDNGNVYVLGYVSGKWEGFSHGGKDIFLGKFDTDGTLMDVQQMGTSGWEVGNGITLDPQGNIYFTGSTTGSWFRPHVGAEDLIVGFLPAEQ